MDFSALFQTRMTEFLSTMEIHLSDEQKKDVYTLTLNDTTLHFFAMPESFLSVIAEIGVLPDVATSDVLMELLHFNNFTPSPAQFNFKVGVDRDTRKIELWIRQDLMSLDSAQLSVLLGFAQQLSERLKLTIERCKEYTSLLDDASGLHGVDMSTIIATHGKL